MSNSGHAPPLTSPYWLPAGWSVEFKSTNGKNIKSYVDQLTGHRFYSKPKVLEYLRAQKNYSWTSQKEASGSHYDINLPEKLNETPRLQPHRSVTETPYQENGLQRGNIFEAVASENLRSGEIEAEESPAWLPYGWTQEVKVRDGQIVKTYVDPLWGHRFYTKPQVLQYLGVATNDSSTSQKETANSNSESSLLEKISGIPEPLPRVSILEIPWESCSQNKVGASEMSSYSGKTVSEKKPDWLPTGWTEEVKIKNGRNFKSFVESSSGRRFYSKPKVLEYIGTANISRGTSERKKIGNDFDINLPVDIYDPLESLSHGQTTELETRENGSQSGKNFKHYIDSKQKIFEHLGSVRHDSATSHQKKMVREHPIVDRTEGVTPSSQPVESQNVKTINNTIQFSTPKETSSRTRPVRKNKTVGVTPPPQLVESQNVKALNDTIHLSISKETSSRKRPGRKALNKTGVGTPPAQLVESETVKPVNHDGDSSTLKETSPSKQPGIKIGMEQLPEKLPPGWITEVKIKRTGNKTKKLSYYIDPVNGYVFSSQKDCWRYLEAGDINKCVIKPKKREEMGFTTKVTPNLDKVGSTTPSQLLEEPKYVSMRKKARFSPEIERLSSSKECDTEIVIERVAAEGLPSGWIKEVKIENFYTDPRSGYVFMSQKDALRYLETGDIGTCAIKPRSRDELGLNEGNTSKMNKIGGSPLLHLQQFQNENTARLTRLSSQQKETSSSKQSGGEVVEIMTPIELHPGPIKKSSIKKKATGTRRDTPQVPALQQLEQPQAIHTPKPASVSTSEKEVTSFKHNGIEIVMERVAPTGLPPGWIKEIRIQKRTDGIRKDTFYTDLASGYVFSSQKDVFRYVKTGDTRVCAIKPKKREELGFHQINSITSPDAMQNLVRDTTKKQLSAEVGSKRSLETMDSDVTQERRQTRSINASPAVVQKLEHDSTGKQLFTGKVISEKRLETLDSNVSQKQRQTRSAASPAVMQKPSYDMSDKQLTSGKKVGSKRSLEITESDVSQKRRQTRASTASPAVVQKIGSDSTEKQVSKGKKVGSKSSSETMASDVSQKRRETRFSSSAVTTDTPAVELPKEVPKIEKVIQQPTKAKKGSNSKKTPLSKTKVSKKEQDSINSPPSIENIKVKKVSFAPSAENSKVKNVASPPSSKKLKIKNIKKKDTKKKGNQKTRSPATKTKKETKKEMRTPPSRVSKRISGIGMETLPNSGSSELAIPSKKEKGGKIKNIPCLNVPNNEKPCEPALSSEVQNSGKEDFSITNNQNNIASCEKVPTSEVENSGKEDASCLNNENNVDSCAKVPISEVENSGENNNDPNNVDENTSKQLETVPEMEDTEVRKYGQNEEIPYPDTRIDVSQDVPEEVGTVSEMEKINNIFGGAEAILNDEVSNMSNEVPKDQGEEKNVSEEQFMDISNKSEESMEETTELQEQIMDLSNKSNAAMEDQTVSQKQIMDFSNQSKEAMDDKAEDQIISQKQFNEFSKKSDEAIESQAEDQTVSEEQPFSNKSNEVIEDQSKNQAISQDQQPMYQFGEENTWSDPCLDFAFKTLTGTLPFVDNVPEPNIFQARGDTSQVKTSDNSLTLMDFGGASDNSHAQNGSEVLRQVDGSDERNGSEAPLNSENIDNNATFLPDMNSSLPSGGEIAPQQNESDENKNEENELTLDNYARFLF